MSTVGPALHPVTRPHRFPRGILPRNSPRDRQDLQPAHASLVNPPPWWQRFLGPFALGWALRYDYRLSMQQSEQTLAFVTLSPCHGTKITLRNRPIPGMIDFMLRHNRVDPLPLANASSGRPG